MIATRGRASLATGVCGAVLVGLACTEESAPEATSAPHASLASPAPGAESPRAAPTGRRAYPGRIARATTFELAFQVAGKLVELTVAEGDRVPAGAVVARLDPSDYRAGVEKAEATADAVRAEYERRRRLLADGVVTEQDVERGRLNLDVASANAAVQRRILADTVLRAPVDGTISRRLANEREAVAAHEPIVELRPGPALEIAVDVPARDLTGLSAAERAEAIDARVVVPEISGRELPARLKELAAVDPRTGTVRATFSFDGPSDVDLQPGAIATVVVAIDGSG